jgi:hypothetical protein
LSSSSRRVGLPESRLVPGYGALQQKFDCALGSETLIRKKRMAAKGLPQILCAITGAWARADLQESLFAIGVASPLSDLAWVHV